jgi:hypothetical protein
MKYEWDEAKNRTNVAKHGLSFEDAEQVLQGLASPSKTIVLLTARRTAHHFGLAGWASGCHSPCAARRRDAHLHEKGKST